MTWVFLPWSPLGVLLPSSQRCIAVPLLPVAKLCLVGEKTGKLAFPSVGCTIPASAFTESPQASVGAQVFVSINVCTILCLLLASTRRHVDVRSLSSSCRRMLQNDLVMHRLKLPILGWCCARRASLMLLCNIECFSMLMSDLLGNAR